MKIFPDRIKTVALTAPAGALDSAAIDAGITALEKAGLKILPSENLRCKCGYLAGTAAERAAGLQSAWLDERTDLVLCLRGGFGNIHLTELLDWQALKQRDIPAVGFSDTTALHFAMTVFNAGTPVAGPMLKMLTAPDEKTAQGLYDALNQTSRKLGSCDVIRPGTAVGLPLVGNLTVAASLAGTGLLPDTDGRVIILEEVGEAPYRIDRCLTQLRLAGFFNAPAAVIWGRFTGCGEYQSLLEEFSGDFLKCPVLAGFPFGHDTPMLSINFRQKLAVNCSEVSAE